MNKKFDADVVSASDFTPFGMAMSARKYSTPSYRYSFNTQEKIEELGEGHTTALYWEYDGRSGRRWNIDPVIKDFESPYLCFSGNPIMNTDVNGDDAENSAKKGFEKILGSIQQASKSHGQENFNPNHTEGLLGEFGKGFKDIANSFRTMLKASKHPDDGKIGLLNGPRRWWKKNIGWFDKQAGWKWRRNTHTHNYFFGIKNVTLFKWTTQEWVNTGNGSGVGTGGVDVNYTSGVTGRRYANQYRFNVDFTQGAQVQASGNGGAFQFPMFGIVNAVGLLVNSMTGQLIDGIRVSRSGITNWRVTIPIGVQYSWTAQELINVRHKFRLPLPSFWEE